MAGGIEYIYISDREERHAPPSMGVLEVGVVGDELFLAIGKVDWSFKTRTFTAAQSVSVRLSDLCRALDAFNEDDA